MAQVPQGGGDAAAVGPGLLAQPTRPEIPDVKPRSSFSPSHTCWGGVAGGEKRKRMREWMGALNFLLQGQALNI